jgi:hypothetical protein
LIGEEVTEVQKAVRQVMLDGIIDVRTIIETLVVRGFGLEDVIKELQGMAGPEVHLEDRWHPPSPQDLAALRTLRNKLEDNSQNTC